MEQVLPTMTVSQLFKNLRRDKILQHTNPILDFLKYPLPEEAYQNYYVDMIVTEFVGHHESFKRFPDIERFDELIRGVHPRIYQEAGEFIVEALIRYYILRGNELKLAEQVKNLLVSKREYEFYGMCFDQLRV